MDELAARLGLEVAQRAMQSPASTRYLVGIAGVPGSGKTTLAKHVCAIVNAELQKLQASSGAGPSSQCPEAVIVGMDGWHYSRAQLSQFPDPQEAKDRRGAAFTFDSAAFADFVEQLKAESAGDEAVLAPSFDHALKDPVADDVRVESRHRVVIIEGLYCNCDDGEWARGARALNERWVVQVERQVARERLRVRHVLTGVAKDEEEALWRGEYGSLDV